MPKYFTQMSIDGAILKTFACIAEMVQPEIFEHKIYEFPFRKTGCPFLLNNTVDNKILYHVLKCTKLVF